MDDVTSDKSDPEALARYRKDRPYISLAQARELRKLDMRFGHLGKLKVARERAEVIEKDRQLRKRLFGVDEG